jgi:hypothetical protein
VTLLRDALRGFPNRAPSPPRQPTQATNAAWTKPSLYWPRAAWSLSPFCWALTTDWKVRHLAADQLLAIIAQHKYARFEVFEYRDGSRKLWISDVRSPEFIAPTNESTLGLLARLGITYQTYLRCYRPRGLFVPPDAHFHRSGSGRIGPSQSASALGMLVLVAAAGTLLRWTPKGRLLSSSRA